MTQVTERPRAGRSGTGILGCIVLLGLFLGGCGKGTNEAPPDPAGNPAAKKAPLFEDREALPLRGDRGRVVVLELGCVGCPGGSAKMYEGLLELRKDLSDDVVIYRVDYGQRVEGNREYYKNHPPTFHVIGDPTGKIGRSLPSQAIPTLYLFGKWGQIRFTGGWDATAVREMVEVLKAEKKPEEKNFFTKEGLVEGNSLVDFTLPALSGMEVSSAKTRKDIKAFILIFAGTDCSISRNAVKTLGMMAPDFSGAGAAILVVNIGEEAESIREVYDMMGLPFPVLVDPDEAVAKQYGIDSVPTIFVAGPDGKIALRSLWNQEAVVQEVEILTGRKAPTDRVPVQEEGTG
ncbi:MAG: redoxin domain-containing protein [Planctomycetota bacterium]|jgi:peroxiredoxin